MSKVLMQYIIVFTISSIYEFYRTHTIAEILFLQSELIPVDENGYKDPILWDEFVSNIYIFSPEIEDQEFEYCDERFVAVFEDGSKLQVNYPFQQICGGGCELA